VANEDIERIRELFQDPYVRARLQEADSIDEALGVVVVAGSANRVSFDADTVGRLVDVFSAPKMKGPDPSELKWAGGRMMAGTHVHMSCCTDCPSSAALCC